MQILRVLSAAEQVAAYLSEQIAQGNLTGELPGVARLAADLGVNHKTVEVAISLLEDKGLLQNQGPRRNRLILSHADDTPYSMRICILLYEASDFKDPLLMEIQHALIDVGHTVSFAAKTLTEMKMDLGGVQSLVANTEADAWIVVAGSRMVLEWFGKQPFPMIALYGRRSTLRIASAGPRSGEGLSKAIHHLVEQGHRRIVKICRSERRKPNPGRSERLFLKILNSYGIPTGKYNLPDWEETPEGLQELLKSLFLVTPPTAVFVDESIYLFVVIQFLGKIGLKVPEDVSVFCTESDPRFSWCQPEIAHLTWDHDLVVRRIVRWSVKVSQKQTDLEAYYVPVDFVNGPSIGPAPERASEGRVDT